MASRAALGLRRAAGALPIAIAACAMLRAHASAQPAPVSSRPTFEPCPEVSCKSKEELAAMFGGLDQRPRRFMAGGGSRTATGAATAAMAGAGAAAAVAAAPLPPSDCPLDREELGRRAWGFVSPPLLAMLLPLLAPANAASRAYPPPRCAALILRPQLHSVAAYYPEAPSAEERAAAAGLVAALRHLYPCTHCRAALAKDIEVNPPRLGSRAEFVLWVCEQHNMVNEALGACQGARAAHLPRRLASLHAPCSASHRVVVSLAHPAAAGKPTFPCRLPELDARWRTGRKECWGGGAAAQTAEESLGQAADDA